MTETPATDPSPSSARASPLRIEPRHGATLALVLGWLFFFLPHLIDREGVPYYRDLARLYIPIRTYLHETLKSGALPRWYPYDLMGAPFIGQIATATFHPETLIFLPFDPLTAVKLNILFAYLFGAVGAYRFARTLPTTRLAALCAAAALAFGGYALGMHSNLPYLMGQVTLPWVGWAALKVVTKERLRDSAVLGVAWALVFLGGDAQGACVATLLALGALAMRGISVRRAGLLALGGGLAAMLAGVELLPASAIYATSARATSLGSGTGSLWPLHPIRLMELVLPGFVPDDQLTLMAKWLFGIDFGVLWSTTIFAGGLTCGLAAVAASRRDRRAWTLLVIALVGLWMSLGDRGGLWTLAATVVPPLRRFAYPEKYLALFFTALAPLAALGFDRARSEPKRAVKVLVLGAVLLVGAIVALRLFDVPGYLFRVTGHALDADDPSNIALQQTWTEGATTTLCFLLAGTAMVWLARERPRMWIALPLLVFLELWRGNGGHLPLVDRKALTEFGALGDAMSTMVAPGQPPPRVFSNGGPPDWHYGMLHDSEKYARGLTAALRTLTPATHGIGIMGEYMLPALPGRETFLIGPQANHWSPTFHGCFRVEDGGHAPQAWETLVASDEPFHVSLLAEPCRPYAFIAGAQAVTTTDEARAAFAGGLPRDTIVWEGGPAIATVSGEANVKSYAPGRIVVETSASQPSALFVAEAFAAGWSARVDGAAAQLRPANIVGLGVEVPAGAHSVELIYRTPRFVIGVWLSLVGLIATVIMTLAGGRPRSQPSA